MLPGIEYFAAALTPANVALALGGVAAGTIIGSGTVSNRDRSSGAGLPRALEENLQRHEKHEHDHCHIRSRNACLS